MSEQKFAPESSPSEGIEQDRIIILSDGVFAIAITLLVLDIRLPDGVSVTDLPLIVSSLLPHFIGYTISFVVIASYWLGHRTTMKAMARVDHTFLWLNLLFLFFIAVFPVPTSLLGLHFGMVVPTIIYACFSAVTGLSLWLLWMYATSRPGLLHPHLDPRDVRYHSMFYFLRSIVYLISLFILFVPLYGTYIFFSIWAVGVPLLLAILKRIFLPRLKARKAST